MLFSRFQCSGAVAQSIAEYGEIGFVRQAVISSPSPDHNKKQSTMKSSFRDQSCSPSITSLKPEGSLPPMESEPSLGIAQAFLR